MAEPLKPWKAIPGGDRGVILYTVRSAWPTLAVSDWVRLTNNMTRPTLVTDRDLGGDADWIKWVLTGREALDLARDLVGRQAAIDALSSYRPEQVALAGEGTGAVMMPQFRFVYDGIASMLAVLSMMHGRSEALSGILGSYPRYSILKGQLPLVSQRIPALLTDLQKTYGDGRVNVLDGLRVDWPGRWFHVRVSQTEPIVRIICEQRGEPPSSLYQALVEQARNLA